MGAQEVKMLSVETVGSIWIPAVEKTGRGQVARLEHSEICTWSVAFEWESGAEICPAEAVLYIGGDTGTW